MLTAVFIRNERNEELELQLESYASGYLIRKIEGLDQGKASISSSPLAKMDGDTFQGARRDPRNITMQLELVTDYVSNTVRGLRNQLSNYLPLKSIVTLRFVGEGEETVTIEGVVEAFEGSLFTDVPTVDISLLCLSPDFVGVDVRTVSGGTVPNTSGTPLTINYQGGVPVGYVLQLNVNRACSGFTLHHTTASGATAIFPVETSFVAGDVVTISLEPGNKFILKNNIDSVLYAVPATAVWPLLVTGPNQIHVTTSGTAIPYTITYVNKYGGL